MSESAGRVVAREIRWQGNGGSWSDWIHMSGEYDPACFPGILKWETRALVPEQLLVEAETKLARVTRWVDGIKNHPNVGYNPELYETALKIEKLISRALTGKSEETR